MSYIEIVYTIMIVLGFLSVFFPLEYAIYFIVGIFYKGKPFPEREEKLRYGVIVCARNEEKVIGNLVESIKKSDYPQEKLDIFVIAHNCTDNTAEIARQNGAIVYEYNNENEKTKGYALKHIFECINRDYGTLNYDGFHIFDADNVLDKNYFNKMNDAFLAYDKKCAVTSFRNSKNFGANVITACYGILYAVGCRIEACGRMALKTSARILGSGFLVSSEMVKDGWNIVILSDDTDFTIEQVLKGNRVIYCNDAMYYDEHPTTIKAMWRQRLRWAKGTFIVLNKRFKSLFCYTFGRRKKGEKKRLRASSLDLLCCILPVGIIGLGILGIDLILRSLAPLFNCDPAIVWKNWAILFGVSTALSYLGLVLIAIITYIIERKRIKNVSTSLKIASVFIWPIFATLLVFLQLTAMFKKKFAWTPIVHSNSSNYETFNSNLKDENKQIKDVEMITQNNMDIQVEDNVQNNANN